MTPGEFIKIAAHIHVSEIKIGDLFWTNTTDDQVNFAVVTFVCRTNINNKELYTVNYVDLKSGQQHWADFDFTDSLKGIPA